MTMVYKLLACGGAVSVLCVLPEGDGERGGGCRGLSRAARVFQLYCEVEIGVLVCREVVWAGGRVVYAICRFLLVGVGFGEMAAASCGGLLGILWDESEGYNKLKGS